MEATINYSFSRFKRNLYNLFEVEEWIPLLIKLDSKEYKYLTETGNYLDIEFSENDTIFELNYPQYKNYFFKFFKQDLDVHLMNFLGIHDFLLFQTRFIKERWVEYKLKYLRDVVSFCIVDEQSKNRLNIVKMRLEYYKKFLFELMDEVNENHLKDIVDTFNYKYKLITKLISSN